MTLFARGRTALVCLAMVSCIYALPPSSPHLHALPAQLSQSGLYADILGGTLAPGVRPYTPSYELWSDGATKRRWIRLPAGATIDASNHDDWQFPVGTRLWKEFARDGLRVETRALVRISNAPDGWASAAYLWSPDQHDATLLIEGRENALGTGHDVPSSRACAGCHAGRASYVLGFSALQLSHAAATEGDLTLDELRREGLVSGSEAAPFTVPGDATAQAALGYLHANCGNCHNSARPSSATYMRARHGPDLWLTQAESGTVKQTRAYRTMLDEFVHPGSPADSKILRRMHGQPWILRRMPPIASEQIDHAGEAAVARWISELR